MCFDDDKRRHLERWQTNKTRLLTKVRQELVATLRIHAYSESLGIHKNDYGFRKVTIMDK